MQSKLKNIPMTMPLSAIVLMASLLVITGGFLLYHFQKNKIVYEKKNELAAISSLKIDEITNWRREHIRDGKILSRIVPRNQLVFLFLNDNNHQELRQEMLKRMEIFIENYDYQSILLLDTSGVVRLAYPSVDTTINITQMVSDPKDVESSEISLSELHYSDDLPGMIHMDVQIPLFSEINARLGTIILRVNPYNTLFPLIQSWPTPSKSSETLIVRGEGDSLIFLNELRHRKNSALKFKMPLSDKSLPASMAVSGYEGVFEGKDYRGIPVISYLKRVPDSPWFMIAKVDRKEIYSSITEQIILIFSIVILLILSIVVFIFYYRRNQHISYLKELNAIKDKFFSIVSHDLRSPFTSINGFANFLVEEVHKKDFSNVERYSEIILSSSQNAMDLLRNLTEWSRLQTNRIVFNPKEMEVELIVDEVAELMNAPAHQKSITISKDLPAGLMIYADKNMISTVLRNLVSNSIKFSRPGGRIYITVIQKTNEILFKIKDHGVGMKKEIIDSLFDIDQPVSMPGTQKEHGTGLGLILVKEFIAYHGGKIWVESEFGKCSKFMFTLPVKRNSL